MKGHGEKLSRKKNQAIAALLELPTIRAAAEAVGVGESTLYRWLGNDSFREAYAAARAEVVRHAVANLQRSTSEAVEALREVLNDSETPASARI